MQDLTGTIPAMNGANCWEVISATVNPPVTTNVSINTEYVDCGRCTAVSFNSYTGSSLTNACNGTIITPIYYRGTLGVGTILYENSGLTTPIVPIKYVNDFNNSQVYVIGTESPEDGYVTSIATCPLPTPTPTPAPSPVILGGSFTVYYGSSELGTCALTANRTIFYKQGDAAALVSGNTYYGGDGLPFDGGGLLYTQGVNEYGPINQYGLFTQSGNCP
jgi:hypothetical protein